MKLFVWSILCLLICYLVAFSNTLSTTKMPASKSIKGKANEKMAGDAKKIKEKKNFNIRTPFDKVLDKLSKCALSSPSLVDVMQDNLNELQTDNAYMSLFNAAPHTDAYLKKKKHDSTKFINGLKQALSADWSDPKWKSANEIDTLFRPLKQQFVYAMMRFNCT